MSIVHGVRSLVCGPGFLRVFPTQSEQPAREKVKRADVPDHATGSEPGNDATKRWPGEGFKRRRRLDKMDEAVKAKVENGFVAAL